MVKNRVSTYCELHFKSTLYNFGGASLQESALCGYFEIKMTMGKSNHFGEQPLYGQVIKLFDKQKISDSVTIVNYFNDRLTNASAESFNAKIKGLRRQFRGIRDTAFFLLRLSSLYG